METQKGDPELQYETLRYNANAIRIGSPSSGKASFESWNKNLRGRIISMARTFVGNSRTSTPAQIEGFLKLFGLPMRDKNNDFVPFCAAGVSFCALMTYATSLRRSVRKLWRSEGSI